MSDLQYITEVIETICHNCPLGVVGRVDASKEFCGSCPIFPMKKSVNISPHSILKLSSNDTWLPCSKCSHAVLAVSKENSEFFDIHLKDILFCLDCPAKQIRDCIDESCAETSSS